MINQTPIWRVPVGDALDQLILFIDELGSSSYYVGYIRDQQVKENFNLALRSIFECFSDDPAITAYALAAPTSPTVGHYSLLVAPLDQYVQKNIQMSPLLHSEMVNDKFRELWRRAASYLYIGLSNMGVFSKTSFVRYLDFDAGTRELTFAGGPL